MKSIYVTLLTIGLGVVLYNNYGIAQSLDQFLDSEGYISEEALRYESIDAEGWHVKLDPDGTPRFLRHDQAHRGVSALPPQYPDDIYWDNFFGSPSTVGSIRVVALSGCNNIYLGGDFTSIGGIEARNIAHWDGESWHSLGEGENNGVDGTVHVVTVNGDDVYVGGRFDSAGTELVYNIARWDGLAWYSVGGGVDAWDEYTGPSGSIPEPGTVYTIAVEGSDIYIGGIFDSVGTAIATNSQIFARNIAMWNGSEWKTLGSGLEGAGDEQPTDLGAVRAIRFGFDGIYAAGRFTSSGDIELNGLARWDGTAWRPVGSNPSSARGKVDIFTMQIHGADVYIGGRFDQVGGLEANNIAVWAGLLRRWYVLGEGSTDTVRSLFVNGERVLAAGRFKTPEGKTPNHVAVWTDGQWQPLGRGENNGTDDIVWSIAATGDNVYLTGPFKIAGPTTASGIAAWNVATQTWKPLNQSFSSGGGANGPVYAVALTDDFMYIGGRFSTVGLVKTNSLARWNRGTRVWSPLGGGIGIDPEVSTTLLPSVRAIATDGDNVYVGGRFDFAGGVRANNIAEWDGSQWSGLGDGIGPNAQGGPYDSISIVHAVEVKDGQVYAGGEFILAGGNPANRIAQWDEATREWTPLGGGIGGSSFSTKVSAIALSGNDVFVGGVFPTAGPERASNIARFDGARWHALGRGINNEVYALTVADDGTLYAGGNFNRAGNTEVRNVARWDGNDWSALGSGTNNFVRALATGKNGVYASGDFLQSGVNFTSHIAQWDGSQWLGLGSGLEGDGQQPASGRSLAVDNDEVYVGGIFAIAGGKSSVNVARWSKPGNRNAPTGHGVAARNRALNEIAVHADVSVIPNPIVSSAEFVVHLSAPHHVRLELFSTTGKVEALIYDGVLCEGEQRIGRDASDLSSGYYTWRLTTEAIQQTGTLLVEH